MDSPDSPRFTLDQPQALGLLAVYCVVYVAPLYASPATRPSKARSRDAPGSIRPRVRAVSLSTTACSLFTFWLLHRLRPADPGRDHDAAAAQSPWHLMGYWPLGLPETARALALTALLFAGPLYEVLLVDGGWRQWVRLEPLADIWADWPTWRMLVAGPVTEECLFRSAAIPLLLHAGCSLKTSIFVSPLVFGLAHLHHFYEFRTTHPEVPLAAAIVRSLFQLTYTSLFGAYATFIFLRTGSLLAVVLVHAFCNAMGLPRLSAHLEPYWHSEAELSRPNSAAKLWTGLYYALLVIGSIAWRRSLFPLTESTMALADF